MSSLTGGTGDYNHQLFKMQIVQPNTATTNSIRYQLPIQRLPQKGRAQVIEVTKIHVYVQGGDATAGHLDVALMTQAPPATFTLVDPAIVVCWRAPTGSTTSQKFAEINVTDGSGRGLLVASDALYLTTNNSATTAQQTVTVHMHYRFKNVGVKEYIGIVQSQSST